MSNKLLPSGKKPKDVSDPQLAKSHEAGAIVELVQIAVNPRWGRFQFIHYQRYGVILLEAEKYYKETLELLDQCHKLAVSSETNDRLLPDKLKEKLEIASMKFIVFTKLGLEYLTEEMNPVLEKIRRSKNQSVELLRDNTSIIPKLRVIMRYLQIEHDIPNIIVTLLEERRDIIEHPTPQRLYSGSSFTWKTNHLAWVLCGELEGSFEHIASLVNEIAKKYEIYVYENPVPGRLQGLQRGIRAKEPAKKSYL